MLKDAPGEVRIVEIDGKYAVFYPIGTWFMGQRKWKERKKRCETHEQAVELKAMKEREVAAAVEMAGKPKRPKTVSKLAKDMRRRTGATLEDWRMLLWGVTCLVVDSNGDAELNERAKVIASLASTAKKFLEQSEPGQDLPTDKLDPKVVLEQLRWMVKREEERLANAS